MQRYKIYCDLDEVLVNFHDPILDRMNNIIDDAVKNIIPWNRRGGIGIWHNRNNVIHTIDKLKKYLILKEK